MKVGFIGLGNMGTGMAGNLLKAGHEVTVYNRTSGRGEAGVLGSLGKGTIHISASTISVALAEKMAAGKLWITAAGETLPLASLIRDRFLTLLAHGGESLDWSAIAQLAAEDAGQTKTA